MSYYLECGITYITLLDLADVTSHIHTYTVDRTGLSFKTHQLATQQLPSEEALLFSPLQVRDGVCLI